MCINKLKMCITVLEGTNEQDSMRQPWIEWSTLQMIIFAHIHILPTTVSGILSLLLQTLPGYLGSASSFKINVFLVIPNIPDIPNIPNIPDIPNSGKLHLELFFTRIILWEKLILPYSFIKHRCNFFSFHMLIILFLGPVFTTDPNNQTSDLQI